jgi:limonene-1,2-epoxide hydrolase
MAGTGRRGRVEAFLRALAEQDFERIRSLVHDDYVEEYPQSGERIRGAANLIEILRNYPGGGLQPGDIDLAGARIIGEDEQWVAGPGFGVVHVAGTGDEFTGTTRIRYPDGTTWLVVAVLEFRGDRIARNTEYFAPVFEAPAWRAPWVERYAAT